VPAPLFFVSTTQINFQFPWELAGATTASVTVTISGVSSSPVTMTLGAAGPGVFSTNSQGTGQGTILIANTDILAAPAGSVPGRNTRPVQRGDFISIFCNGLGAVQDPPAAGTASAGQATLATPTVTIGGVPAQVTFSGLAPGFVALYQVNVQVPPAAPIGDAVAVAFTIGGVAANPTTIAVQ
jgi:uncharacterized protein (TIGR03437 family)